MAKKKEYHIPMIDVISVRTNEMMWELGGSGSHEQTAPPRLQGAPPSGSVKAF